MVDQLLLANEYVAPSLFKVISNASKIHKERVEGRNEVLQRATKAFKYPVTGRLEKECNRLSNGNIASKGMYMKLAGDTCRLVSYTLWYMTNADVELIDANDTEKEFINAIGDYVGYGKLYREAGSSDLEWYDAKKRALGYSGPFLICIEDLEDIRIRQDFDRKWHETLQKRNIETEVELPSPVGTAAPVVFNAWPELRHDIKPLSMPEVLFTNFEVALDPFLRKMIHIDHWYDVDPEGNYVLNIQPYDSADNVTTYSPMIRTYTLDSGYIMGGSGISIMGKYGDPTTGWVDNIFVNVDQFPGIVTAILSSPYYVMGPEAQEVFNAGFNNGKIYRYIDLSNTYFLDTISKEDKVMLNRTLSGCISVMDFELRYRIEDYVSPTKYKLIADQKCISTLKAYGATAPINVSDPITIEFDGNKIVKTVGGKAEVFNVNFS